MLGERFYKIYNQCTMTLMRVHLLVLWLQNYRVAIIKDDFLYEITQKHAILTHAFFRTRLKLIVP